jgi:integrase
LLGKQTDAVQHQEALPYERIHEFVRQLREHNGIGSEPLEWLILTATRTSETLLADWTEIDLKAKAWTIPGPRRKGKKRFRCRTDAWRYCRLPRSGPVAH